MKMKFSWWKHEIISIYWLWWKDCCRLCLKANSVFMMCAKLVMCEDWCPEGISHLKMHWCDTCLIKALLLFLISESSYSKEVWFSWSSFQAGNKLTVIYCKYWANFISLIWNTNPWILCEGLKKFCDLMPNRVQILLFVFSNVLDGLSISI